MTRFMPAWQIFGLLQSAVTVYAIVRGGRLERAAGLAMPAALLAGWLLPYDPHVVFRHVDGTQLAIDIALAAVFYALALGSDRYWPIWMTALQLLALAMHGVRAYDSDLLPIAYHQIESKLAYPMLALLVVGTFRFSRRELTRTRC